MTDEVPTGRWSHSFEEDHEGVLVYRREDFAFPPARGRDGIELGSDGSYVDWVTGPADARQPVSGRWRRRDARTLEISTSARGERTVEVVLLTPDRLELRRVGGR